MKNMYICEKCGKMFTEWEDAYKCENSHIAPELMTMCNLPEDVDMDLAGKLTQYAPGEEFPSIVTMRFHKVDKDGCYLHDENGVEQFTLVQYAPVKRPNSTLMAQLTEANHQRAAHDKKVNDEWWENYQREQEEKRARAQEEAEIRAQDCATTESNEEESDNQ